MNKYVFGIITSHMSEHFLDNPQLVTVDTPWGAAELYTGQVKGVDTAICLRYGDEAALASHLVNFRANIWAMKKMGVSYIISQNAIGSCNPHIRPGDFVIPDDAMDFTKNRVRSFFEEDPCWVRVDMTNTFCSELRKKLLDSCMEEGVAVCSTGTFVCTEGPRFETPAEVRFYNSVGGDILGTPMFPELVLAKEAGICYASLSMVINMCTGMGPEIYQSGDDGLMTVYERTGMEEKVERILQNIALRLPKEHTCICKTVPQKGFYGTRPAWYEEADFME